MGLHTPMRFPGSLGARLLLVPALARVPVRHCTAVASAGSVSGVIYSGPAGSPHVQLYTKAGCTLCDTAKEVLARAADEKPHTLEAVDITDVGNEQWWGKYKYDIPVLSIDGKFFAKHRCAARLLVWPCTRPPADP